MNFLQIAQRIRQEMGTGGLGPSTLLAQFGEDKQYTDWTREAYIDVLNYARDWNFLWKEFQFVGNGGREYGEAEHGITDVATWNVDTFYSLQNGAMYPLHFIPWDEFRLYQASVMVNGLPASFSIQPGGTLVFDAAHCIKHLAHPCAAAKGFELIAVRRCQSQIDADNAAFQGLSACARGALARCWGLCWCFCHACPSALRI